MYSPLSKFKWNTSSVGSFLINGKHDACTPTKNGIGAVRYSRNWCGRMGRKMWCHLNGAIDAAAACTAPATAPVSLPLIITRRSKRSAANNATAGAQSVNAPRRMCLNFIPKLALACVFDVDAPSSGAKNDTLRGRLRESGGCQLIGRRTSAFGRGVPTAHSVETYANRCVSVDNTGVTLSGLWQDTSRKQGDAHRHTCASIGSSACSKNRNHCMRESTHVTIGNRGPVPGGRNLRQCPVVRTPSLSVKTKAYMFGFKCVSGTKLVKSPLTYSGKQKCFSKDTVIKWSSEESPPKLRRSRSFGAGDPVASTETPTTKNPRPKVPARGAPRDAIVAQGTLHEGSPTFLKR